MKGVKQKAVILLAIAFGSVVGVFKGNEAKQKTMFKILSRFDEKKHLSTLKREKRQGMVLLDDIEMASFHGN